MKIRCPSSSHQACSINLTSICQFCQQDGVGTKLSDGSYICRPCLRVKYYDWWVIVADQEIRLICPPQRTLTS